jgi:hypothetical protein
VSNKLDAIKNKVRRSSGDSVHVQMIDTNIIEDDRKAMIGQPTQQASEELHADGNEPAGKKERKKKFEDLYTRQTIWVKKEYVQMIEEESDGERGEKTRILNDALKEYFSNRKR